MSNIHGNLSIRLARMEAMCNQVRAEMDDILQNAYQVAIEEQDEERAAGLARKIRNKLLSASDAHATVDRPSDDEWVNYRKALRDLPEQEGFPFEVEFPTAPHVEEGNTVLERIESTENDNLIVLEGIAEIYEMMLGGE